MTNREIDALVAEKVMGWRYWRLLDRDEVHFMSPETSASAYIRSLGMDQVETGSGLNAPHFSTDIVASKQLRDKVHADGWYWALDGRHEKDRAPFKSLIWRKAAISAPAAENFFSAGSDTEQMAVALSVLKAYGVEVG